MTAEPTHSEALFIIGKTPADWSASLLPHGGTWSDTSVVLIQDAVAMDDIPASSVKVLEDDLRLRHASSPYPRIGYSALLQMIFEAKKVVVL